MAPCESGLVDADGDGFAAVVADPVRPCSDDPWPGDCDDTDPFVHPYQEESCNERDDDCDGEVDEGLQSFEDEDHDGHGDPAAPLPGCPTTPWASTLPDDCDDGDESVYAGAFETCDLKDNDCDGVVDDDVIPLGQGPTSWRDADGDGAGDPSVWSGTCHGAGEGWIQNFLDCDDADPTLDASTCPAAVRPPPRALADTPDVLTDAELGGASLAFGLDDVDGDGRDDLVLGHEYVARLVSGVSGAVDASDEPTASGEYYPIGGAAIDGDGDGDRDLVLGFDQLLGVFHALPVGEVAIEDADLRVAPPAPASFYQMGRVDDDRVWASSMWAVYLIDATGVGDRIADQAGVTIVADDPQPASGDLDGDGVPELVVGEPQRWVGENLVGSVWVAPTDTSGAVADVASGAWVGDVPSAELGAQVDVGPDVDGDGLDDVLARSNDARAFLFTHAPEGEAQLAPGAAALLYFGPVAAGDPMYERWQELPGDLDGDGFGEVAIAVEPADGVERSEIAVLPGPISGTVDLATAERWVHPASYPAPLTAGDFDGDGLPELAAAMGDVYVVGAPW